MHGYCLAVIVVCLLLAAYLLGADSKAGFTDGTLDYLASVYTCCDRTGPYVADGADATGTLITSRQGPTPLTVPTSWYTSDAGAGALGRLDYP